MATTKASRRGKKRQRTAPPAAAAIDEATESTTEKPPADSLAQLPTPPRPAAPTTPRPAHVRLFGDSCDAEGFWVCLGCGFKTKQVKLRRMHFLLNHTINRDGSFATKKRKRHEPVILQSLANLDQHHGDVVSLPAKIVASEVHRRRQVRHTDHDQPLRPHRPADPCQPLYQRL